MFSYFLLSSSSDTATSVSYSSEDLVGVIPDLQRAIEINEYLKDTLYDVQSYN